MIAGDGTIMVNGFGGPGHILTIGSLISFDPKALGIASSRVGLKGAALHGGTSGLFRNSF